MQHSFYIPVMGTGFTIDTPLAVAKYGISSVIPLVDDILIEKMRKLYCHKFNKPYTAITLLKMHKELYPKIPTKSGIMLGLGETHEETIATLSDLRANNVDMVTLGQYLQPTIKHLKVTRYITPEEFVTLAKLAKQLGFKSVASAPLVRSSYHAGEVLEQKSN